MSIMMLVSHIQSPLNMPWLQTAAITGKGQVRSPVMSQRRSAKYHPTVWDPKCIESFSTSYTYDSCGRRLEELRYKVQTLLATTKDPRSRLDLIDSMQRLGVAYHFKTEIENTMIDLVDLDPSSDLYATALHFRLLRQHSFSVEADAAFNKFRTKNGKFADSLRGDMAGLLSLYNASYLGKPGEDVLEDAMDFSAQQLKSLIARPECNFGQEEVLQALEVPLHWRMPRMEALNFINIYQKRNAKNFDLLELAKLDYNLVQSVHQRELKELARWWRNLGFKEKLPFSRDRLMENYLWAMGIVYEPQFSRYRIGLTKFVCILTAIDDMYDIYGSLDELEHFTDAVNRWDTTAMEELPEYMKFCYLAMFNLANDLAYDVMKENGLSILPHIKNAWTILCGAYLVEARWFYGKYTPSLDEYLANAQVSVGGPSAVVHAYMLLEDTISRSSLDCFKHGADLIHWSSIITRLSDDLGTSVAESERGDVAKATLCYMNEKGASEEEAKAHINELIAHSWMRMNVEKDKHRCLPNSFTNFCLNMARTAQCIFQHGDGIGTSTGETKDRLTSLIVKPIPLEEPSSYCLFRS